MVRVTGPPSTSGLFSITEPPQCRWRLYAGTDLLDLQAVGLIEQLQCSICSDFNPGTAPHLAYSQSMDGIRPDLMRTLPVVMCPGCNRAMIPGEPRKIMLSNDLVDVVYVCEQCGPKSVP